MKFRRCESSCGGHCRLEVEFFLCDIFTFENAKIYEGKQKTAAMLVYKGMIAFIAILAPEDWEDSAAGPSQHV